MNREDIICMAREAGIEDWWDSGNEHREVLQEHLERFAALVASAERTACIKALEDLDAWNMDDPASSATKAIKSSG